MALPVPNLDDRRFQDLVDDAKRLVQQRCPEWTDHNVSDPGVTLIEAFAFMTDQLLYRLNRVPDRHYVKFLELIGVRLFPATGARAAVTFYLTAPRPDPVRIAAGTQASTIRTESDEAITFTTLDDLPIVPCSFTRAVSMLDGTTPIDRTDALDKSKPFEAFDRVPKPGDVLLVGLSDAVPACVVSLRFRCRIEGVGVDPLHPPLVWEAWTGEDWTGCEVERDETGGLNRDGDVVLHVPRGHTASLVGKQRAGWIRARVVEPEEDMPSYSATPQVLGIAAVTVGGTTDAANAEVVTDQLLGESAGVPGQRFPLSRSVIPGDRPTVLRSSDGTGWVEWQQVADFASSGPEDRHFVLDPVAGEVILGPGVRLAEGSFRQYGAVPPKGARLRIRRVSDRRRAAGQRRDGRDQRPALVDPVRRPRRQPAAGHRRRGRRGCRERQGARPDLPADAGPGRHDRGLRADRPRGGARGRPRSGGGSRSRCGCGGGARARGPSRGRRGRTPALRAAGALGRHAGTGRGTP